MRHFQIRHGHVFVTLEALGISFRALFEVLVTSRVAKGKAHIKGCAPECADSLMEPHPPLAEKIGLDIRKGGLCPTHAV